MTWTKESIPWIELEILAISATPVIILGQVFRVLNPELETVRYLYSAIFQGMAALLGLAILSFVFGFDRSRQKKDTLLSDVTATIRALSPKSLPLLNIGAIPTILSEWHAHNYQLLISEAGYLTDSLSSVPKGDYEQLNRYWQLKEKERRYNDARVLFVRFNRENKHFIDLPRRLILAMIPFLATMILSLTVLSGLDSITKEWTWVTYSLLSEVILAFSLFALIYGLWFLLSVFRVATREDYNQHLDEARNIESIPGIESLEKAIADMTIPMEESHQEFISGIA